LIAKLAEAHETFATQAGCLDNGAPRRTPRTAQVAGKKLP
jgi:hypothetical protein